MKKHIFTFGRASGAVAVLAVLILALASGLWFAKEATDATLLELEAKNTSLDAMKKRLLMPVRAATDAGAEPNAFLDGANYALAANGMQQRIVELIESSGGTLVTVGIDPPDDTKNSPGRRVVVQATSELTNDGLQQVLYRLESERPFILVDSLSVRNVPNRGESEGGAGNRSLRLAVDLRAYGFFRGASR